MKRFSYALKFAALMISIFFAGSALAQVSRTPDPGQPTMSAEQLKHKQSQERFLNFVSTLKSANVATLSDNSAANQPVNITQRPKSIMKTAWDVQGSIYAVVPNFDGMNSYGEAFYGTLDTETGFLKAVLRNDAFTNKENAFLQSGFIREDILYIPYMISNMVTQEARIVWKRIDLNTNKTLPELDFGVSEDSYLYFTYGMTYDPIHDVVYGLAYNDASGAGGHLVKIDCSKPVEQWKAQSLFNVGGAYNSDWMAGICYSPYDDTLYGLKSEGLFCEIDLQNKAVVTLKEYEDEIGFPPGMQTNPMVYSPRDKAILYIYGSERGLYGLCSIDMDGDYDVMFIQDLYPMAQVGNLYCADPFGVDEGPDVMLAPELNFEANSLKGTYSFTAPSTYYNGLKLDKNMVMHVLVDDKEVFSKEVAPGETVTNEIEIPQGLHFVSGYCSLGNIDGPSVRKRIYIGNDQPFAPTNLKLEGGVLTWNTPRNIGVNNAYIDLSNVKYNIFIEDEKQNAEPVSGNSYNLVYDKPADGRKSIRVTAIANGVESEKSTALTRVLGQGYELPLTIAPTAAEATLFETNNANRDAYEWAYSNGAFTVHTQEYQYKPDDWLFLPPVYLGSSEQVYTLIANYVNARQNNIQKDNLDIMIGKDPLPGSMTKLIYSHENRIQATPVDLEVTFNVDEPGTYFIGFHSKPGNENLFRGITLNNFRLMIGNGTTGAPGLVTDVKLTPAERGELFVTVDGTLPTKNMKGEELAADEEISVLVTCGSDGFVSDQKTQKGKPGEKFSMILSADIDGYSDIFITPTNAEGDGIKQYFTVYTGIDNPLPPVIKSYKIGPDNLTLEIEWEPVGNVGEHGGYVDTDDVVYDIYTHSTTETTKIASAGKNTTYTYKAQNVPQLYYNIGPVAVNQMGISTNGIFVYEELGKLYNTPVNEEFGYSAFTYQKWMYNTKAPFNNARWEHCTDPDQELGMHISFGQGGSFRAVNDGAGTNYAELWAPHVSTKTDERVAVTLRYWDFPTAGEIELWGRTYENQELRKIETLVPNRPDKGVWEDWKVMLPAEFCKQEWIQINVRAKLTGSQKVVIDNYKITQEIENDFQLTSLTAPYSALIGEEPQFNIVVTNTGAEPGSGTLTLELLSYDVPLDKQVIEIERIRPGENFEYIATFPMKESYHMYDYIELRATTEADDDGNPRNNEQSIDFLLYDCPVPTVHDLKAERDEQNDVNVNLTWSMPEGKAINPESFETYCSLQNSDNIGSWKNVDIDGKAPFVINERRWANDDDPSAWVVFNANEMNTMSDPRLSPRSGQQMLLARSIAYDSSTEKPTRSMDFLISPEVKGGTKVGFWLNTLDSQYAETVAIWYSTSDTNLDASQVVLNDREIVPRECGSFKWLQNFTKSGAETWEYCETTLPADAKYFAFVYSSYGMFGAMIDDITFTPVDPVKVNVESFDVFVAYDNASPRCIAREITTPAYTHEADGMPATYYVKSNVNDGDMMFSSALSNPAKVGTASGISGLENGQYVKGDKGAIIVGGSAGKAFILYDTEGKILAKTILSSDRQTFAVTPGVYIVKVGESIVKIVVR